jgi:[NiFe] hydrogenase assembly HybE family chaperone
MGSEQAGHPVARLAAAFTALAQGAMAGLPIANPALRVEAVGFTAWEENWVGVLITPWAINLMWLPGNPEAFAPPGGGVAQPRRFPSGVYGFHAGHLDSLGPYQSCSLFSPPAEFAGQDSARAVALEIMAALFQPEAALEPPPAAVSRRAFLRGHFGRAE